MVSVSDSASFFPLSLIVLIPLLLRLACTVLFLVLAALAIRALLKYIREKPSREEQASVKRSLGEAIRAHRSRCQMTQEFVAESLGVSRQAVSKWEQGVSEPSTSNLLALAKLFGVSAAELLGEVE